jgi:hypothetical protein
MGWLTVIGDNLAVPSETTVLGVPVVVNRVALNRSDQVVAVCRRGRDLQFGPILDLPPPTPGPKAQIGSRRMAFGSAKDDVGEPKAA